MTLHDEIQHWSESSIKKLDHVHSMLGTIAEHSGDEATIVATQNARELVEEAQADIREMEGIAAAELEESSEDE